jgi:hypothetical protein
MARPCYRAISALEISVTIVTDAAISFIYQKWESSALPTSPEDRPP